MTMKQNMRGIMIAAVKSGSGKTTVTCALLEALKQRGCRPASFKCGPDYIDPMFHKTVIDVPSCNLDSFFCGEELLREIYSQRMADNGIGVVEGVMGLFDGLGGIREEGSAYHVASILQLPILLVVDAHGMGRSIIPLLAGFLKYDRENRIKGVILNRTSRSFCERIAPVIEAELSLPVFGFLPNKSELKLESRHLGLKLPEEVKDIKKQICASAHTLEECVAVDRIIEMSDLAGSIPCSDDSLSKYVSPVLSQSPIRIGIALDEAFCFYYEENLNLLKKLGAKLIPFSPMHDHVLPEQLDGLLLGGGYPELHAKRLEENVAMRSSIRQAIQSGMPSVAECGGFLYLHAALQNEKGETYEMCNVLPGKCFYAGKLVRFGYIELAEKQPVFLSKGSVIKGHEFHYYDSETNGLDCTARKPASGVSFDCIHLGQCHFWGFPHLYYPSNPEFAVHFLEEARRFSEKNLRIC